MTQLTGISGWVCSLNWWSYMPWTKAPFPARPQSSACLVFRWPLTFSVSHCLYAAAAAAAANSLQSRPTLCDPIDGSPPGSPVPGILQARTLEWVAISFSNAWKWKVKVKSLSRVRLLATPWTAAVQAPPSMGFSRQEYWSGLPLPSPTSAYLTNIYWATIIFQILKHISRQSKVHAQLIFYLRGKWERYALNG